MIKNKKNLITILIAVAVVLTISFGVVAANGGFTFLGIPAPQGSDNSDPVLAGYWSLNEDSLTEGEDLVTNGDFATDSDWAYNSSYWSISDNAANYNAVSNTQKISQSVLLKVGSKYAISFEILSGTAHISFNSTTGGICFEEGEFNSNYTGKNTIIATASDTGGIAIFAYNTTGGTAFSLSNVTIKEIDSSVKDLSGNGNDGVITRTDLLDGWDFNNWNDANIVSKTSNTFTTSVFGGIYKTYVTVGNKYKLTIKGSTTAGVLRVYDGASAGRVELCQLSGDTETVIYTATQTQIYLNNDVAGTATIDTFELEDITFEKDQNGVPNQAMSFDGVGDYVDIGAKTVDFSGDFTVSTWVKSDQIGATKFVGGTSDSLSYTSTDGWSIYLGDTGSVFKFIAGDGTNIAQVSNTGLTVANQWYHLLFTWDNTAKTITGYVNGVSVGSDTNGSVGSVDIDNNFYIGRITARYWDGNISDTAVYTEILNQEEVSQLYKAGRTTAKMKVDAKNLVTNGDFDTDSDWNKVGTWTINSGYAEVTGDSNLNYLSQDVGAIIGHKYKIVYEILQNSLVGSQMAFSSTSIFGGQIIPNAVGVHSIQFEAINEAATYDLRFFTPTGTTGGTLQIDNISIVDITNAVTPKLQKGLILDMPLQEPYTEAGSNLVTNGDFFDGSSGWELSPANASIVDGRLYFTGDGDAYAFNNTVPRQDLSNIYEIKFDLEVISGGVRLFNNANHFYTTTKTHTYVGAIDGGVYSPLFDDSGPGELYIDNVFVKRLDGITKDRTPYGNDGTVSGATIKYDGLVNGGDGVAYIPSDTAYGTWEFDIVPTTGLLFQIIGDETNTSNGFSVFVGNNLDVFIRRYVNGTPNANVIQSSIGAVTSGAKYKFKITRDQNDLFSFYIKGEEYGWDDYALIDTGTNTSYGTSSYIVANFGTGDQISNLKINGKPVKLSNATIVAPAVYTTTAPSYEFDGDDDYIDLGMDNPSDLTGDITISAWINPEGWGENNQGRIIDNGKLLMFIVSDGRVFLYSNASLSTASQTSSISLNTWQHVLITRNSAGDETNFYIDGVLSGTANQNSGTPSNIDLTNTFIGNREAGDKTFDGQISGLKIWNRILSDGSGGTENEIEYLYNKERGKY